MRPSCRGRLFAACPLRCADADADADAEAEADAEADADADSRDDRGVPLSAAAEYRIRDHRSSGGQ
jgi:predicted  nucleic acid-binding Zn-ribbon protein